MADFIWMKHPELEGASAAGPVSRSAFKNLWEQKGWVETDRPEATVEEKRLDPRFDEETGEIDYDAPVADVEGAGEGDLLDASEPNDGDPTVTVIAGDASEGVPDPEPDPENQE